MKRIHTLDSLKLFSIMATFCIHYAVFYHYGGIEHNRYYLGINIAARFAVPVFFVISGYLFCHKVQAGGWKYTKKYLSQLLLMYISWTMVYLLAFGIGRNDWRVINVADIFYFGIWGAEILWFLVALTIAIAVLFLAIRIQQTTALFILASLLHFIGLTGQGYQEILPLGLFTPDGDIFYQSRDPLFFALFYVSLGYQMAQPRWQAKIDNIKWQYFAIASAIFLGVSVWEGLTLIESYNAKIADYYISTLPLTLSLIGLALRVPNRHYPSKMSQIGNHSGELYLNHGIFQLMQGTVFWTIGYYRIPEMMAQQANSLWLQSLLVPVMLVINIGVYFALRKVYLVCVGRQVIATYKESAVILNAFWLLFFTMQTNGGGTMFDTDSITVVVTALFIAMTSYCLVLHCFKPLHDKFTQQALKHAGLVAINSALWFVLAYSGLLHSMQGSYNPQTPILESLLSSPLLCATLLFLFIVGITLAIQRKVYNTTPNITTVSIN
ncbi:hypothetical protein C9I98_06125 [Photobacterium sanctipauli]|uniref:Acyltransferase 3 domain-containing protein n=1 Tax=Photobacterium sanctipauli TaxID=1342794 RepID=A0A2T3NYZ7_9GAMM|nr:acyltransferase family protein [Photobacterium sanctipauli]PSW21497.1 hypothetical protein C9I98_06125 [Photobacterium sanctipauli]